MFCWPSHWFIESTAGRAFRGGHDAARRKQTAGGLRAFSGQEVQRCAMRDQNTDGQTPRDSEGYRLDASGRRIDDADFDDRSKGYTTTDKTYDKSYEDKHEVGGEAAGAGAGALGGAAIGGAV